MRKILLGIAGILALGAALIVFLLVHDFDSPELGQAVLDKVGAATGVTVTARTFHLNLLRGLKLEGVEISSRDAGRSLQIAVDSLLFEHRLAPLFSGTIAIERVLLDRPAIVMVDSAAAAAAAPAPAGPAAATAPPAAPAPAGAAPSKGSGGTKFSLELKTLTIRDARVSMTHEKATGTVTLEGLTVNLRDIRIDPSARSLAGVAGAGDVALAKATLNDLAVGDVRSNFTLAAGTFTMPELAATTEYGKATSAMTLDLKPAPFAYALNAKAAAIDLNKILGARGGLGPGSLQLEAQGQGPETTAVKAHGAIELAAGQIPATKLSEAIDRVLGKNALAGSPYKPAKAVFALDRGVITISSLQFEGQRARVDLKGTAALAGALDLELAVATPREGLNIEGVGAKALDVLTDASGWLPVPMHVSGTLDDPKVRPDTSALLAQAKTGASRETKAAAEKAAQKAVAGLKRRGR